MPRHRRGSAAWQARPAEDPDGRTGPWYHPSTPQPADHPAEAAQKSERRTGSGGAQVDLAFRTADGATEPLKSGAIRTR
jgi:hypothetical protein